MNSFERDYPLDYYDYMLWRYVSHKHTMKEIIQFISKYFPKKYRAMFIEEVEKNPHKGYQSNVGIPNQYKPLFYPEDNLYIRSSSLDELFLQHNTRNSHTFYLENELSSKIYSSFLQKHKLFYTFEDKYLEFFRDIFRQFERMPAYSFRDFIRSIYPQDMAYDILYLLFQDPFQVIYEEFEEDLISHNTWKCYTHLKNIAYFCQAKFSPKKFPLIETNSKDHHTIAL